MRIRKIEVIVILFMLIYTFFVGYNWKFITGTNKPGIVSIDLVQLIEQGQRKYSTKNEIELFSKRLNKAVNTYSIKHNVIIISKQVVLKGAKDVTSSIAKEVF